MKKVILSGIFLFTASLVFAQWNPNGANIYNTNTGNVGIGANAPQHKLQIGDASVAVSLSLRGPDGPTNAGELVFEDNAGTTGHWFKLTHNTLDNRLIFSSYEQAQIMSFDRFSGNVGVGMLNAESVLQAGGSSWRKIGLSTEGVTTLGRLGQDYNGITLCSNAYFNGGWYRDDSSKPSFALIEHIGNQRYEFRVANAGAGNIAWSTPMVITASERVGIGTTNPTEKLTVNGTIYGKEVKVDLNVPGPDYVFEKDYNLPSLEEVKSYVEKNKHLPEVPSAKEMEANGINVGEMNMILLKKVEELTLHLIELKHENERQSRLNEQQQEEIEKLKKK